MLEKNDIFLIFNKCKDFEEMSLLFSLNIGRFFKKKMVWSVFIGRV